MSQQPYQIISVKEICLPPSKEIISVIYKNDNGKQNPEQTFDFPINETVLNAAAQLCIKNNQSILPVKQFGARQFHHVRIQNG